MSEKLGLLQLIKEDKHSLSNQEGQKPLFALAERIAQVNFPEEQKKIIQTELLEINLEELNIEEINTYISFINYSKTYSKLLYNKIFDLLKIKFQNKTEEEILRRALLLRFISENSQQDVTLRFLLGEYNVRTNQPWIWVDCVFRYNWSLAEDEIASILTTETAINNLLIRLPTFRKSLTLEILKNACIKWYSNINNAKQRSYLEKWASTFKIKLGISIPAEYRLGNISLFQKPLLNHE